MIILKKRFEQAKSLWANELHAVLWAYHAMPHSSTKETPYRLVYKSNAVVPIKLTEPSSRTITMTEESNELTWRAKLDLAEEYRERAKIKEEVIK